jgi:hypothetical protein
MPISVIRHKAMYALIFCLHFTNTKHCNFYDDHIAIEAAICGLVVRVPGYRSRGPGLTPSATGFSE